MKAAWKGIFGIPKRIIVAVFTDPLAAASFLLASLGGMMAAGTFIGSIIIWIIHVGPVWLPFPLAAVGVVLLGGDLIRDGIPERLAVYISMALPSVFMSMPEEGKLHQKFAGWIKDVNNKMNDWLGEWIGMTGSKAVMTVVAFSCLAAAVLLCERYARGAKGSLASASTTEPVSTTSTRTTASSSRGRGGKR